MSLITIVARFDTVVALLGGATQLCDDLGEVGGKTQTGQAVHIWRKTGRFPSKHYFAIQFLLMKKGCVASDMLFSFNPKHKLPDMAAMVAKRFDEDMQTADGRRRWLRANLDVAVPLKFVEKIRKSRGVAR